jgi:general secretion pathway protein I
MRRTTDERGFTLVEVLVAFTVAALALGAVFELLSGGIAGLRNAAQYAEATQLAESRLESVGIAEPLASGTAAGRFDDRFVWRLDAEALPGHARLYRVRVTVSWRGRSVALESLRFKGDI